MISREFYFLINFNIYIYKNCLNNFISNLKWIYIESHVNEEKHFEYL